jgi:NAD(P)-dependent dehydrogenase (short-subunit alcohol dehydrogenase family)
MYDQSIPAGDLQSEHTSYGPKKLYARTKREQVVITELWAEELRGSGIVVHAMHPGWADTEGVRKWMPVFRAITRPIIRNPEQGADTIVWLGAASEPLESTGDFWHDRRRRPTHYLIGARPDSEETRRELWAECERLLAAAKVHA